ncbi:MAG: hypothetical protein DME22_16820 [Verrucomicrobia bacterium]|nr:MAG: hypothetical protein DME22_16820 [Verrucomicrobiota bacterium]
MKNRILPLYEWVSKNNPAPEKQYDKGWWDTIEFYYRLADTFPDCNASVISTYAIQTPPPCEELLLPTVLLHLPAAAVVLQHDFAPLPPFWTLAIERQTSSPIDVFGLFEPGAITPNRNLARLPNTWRFQPMAKDPKRFCCQVGDEFHVLTFLWILSRGKPPTLRRKRR